MADKFMQTVLTPAVLEAEKHYYGRTYDWNCPKFITPRYTAAEIEHAAAPLRQRIAELETKLKALGQDL